VIILFGSNKNIGNITWNTGVFTTKLNAVTHGTLKPFLGKEKYIRRAQYILSMHNSDNQGARSNPTKGIVFSFEEDIAHQIDEALLFAVQECHCTSSAIHLLLTGYADLSQSTVLYTTLK
jgi:hypothetical protein